MRRKTLNLSLELRRLKRDIIRRWHLDTPTGVMGIIAILSGIMLITVVGSAVAQIFRLFVPWVSGSRVGEVYWQSIGFGIKFGLLFIIFISTLVLFMFSKYLMRK